MIHMYKPLIIKNKLPPSFKQHYAFQQWSSTTLYLETIMVSILKGKLISEGEILLMLPLKVISGGSNREFH